MCFWRVFDVLPTDSMRPPGWFTGPAPNLRLTRQNVCRLRRRHRPLPLPRSQLPPQPWDTIITIIINIVTARLRRPWSAAGRSSANQTPPPPRLPQSSTARRRLILMAVYYDGALLLAWSLVVGFPASTNSCLAASVVSACFIPH